MKRGLIVLITVLFLAVLTACGGESDTASSANESQSSSTVTLEAKNWEFDQQEYTTTAGNITIELKNIEGYHGVTIDGTDVKIDGEGKATASLEAGEYTIRCTIPCGEGHGEMTTKLIVQ